MVNPNVAYLKGKEYKAGDIYLLDDSDLSVSIICYPNTASKNRALASHWRTNAAATREAKEQAMVLAEYALRRLPAAWKGFRLPLEKCEVTITQHHSNTPLDYDGLAMRAAASIDGIVSSGMIADDSPKCIVAYNLCHKKVPKRSENCIEIKISLPVTRLSSTSLGENSSG